MQLEERGPYVYKQTTQQIDVLFNNNKRSSKMWNKNAKFYEDESCARCKENDQVFPANQRNKLFQISPEYSGNVRNGSPKTAINIPKTQPNIRNSL